MRKMNNSIFGELRSLAARPDPMWESVVQLLYKVPRAEREAALHYIRREICPRFEKRYLPRDIWPRKPWWAELFNGVIFTGDEKPEGSYGVIHTWHHIEHVTISFSSSFPRTELIFIRPYFWQAKSILIENCGYYKDSFTHEVLAHHSDELEELGLFDSFDHYLINTIGNTKRNLKKLDITAWDTQIGNIMGANLPESLEELTIRGLTHNNWGLYDNFTHEPKYKKLRLYMPSSLNGGALRLYGDMFEQVEIVDTIGFRFIGLPDNVVFTEY